MAKAFDLLFKIILGLLLLCVCLAAGVFTLFFAPIGPNVIMTVGLVLGIVAAFAVTHVFVDKFESDPANAVPFGFLCFVVTVMTPFAFVIGEASGLGAPIEIEALSTSTSQANHG